MVKPKWAIQNIQQNQTSTGFRIVAKTFQPCHLWMRWTTIKPQEHLKPRTKRGLPLKTDKRFCFVDYKDNKQQETGDTLEHTFIKEPWPICQTRWFYFHGTIATIKSPSTTAIFKKHRSKGLLFYEPYSIPQWPPIGPLFKDDYSIVHYPPPFAIIFKDDYKW